MYKAVLVEDNVSCATDEFKDLVEKIYEYVGECYGTHSVMDAANNKSLDNCRCINSIGEYFIYTRSGNIHCLIDAI